MKILTAFLISAGLAHGQAPGKIITFSKADSLLDEENAPSSGFYAAVVERAAKMVKSWKPRPALDRDHFLRAVIDRIVVQSEHIEIRLRLATFLHELLGSDPAGQGVQTATKFLSIVSVTCPFKQMNSGRALRLVIDKDRLSNDRSRQLILRAIALAHHWYQRIANGEATCLNEIIRQDGIDQSDAKKIFPLAFLSPISTQSILRFNTDFTLKALLANIPMEWSRQNIPLPLHSLE